MDIELQEEERRSHMPDTGRGGHAGGEIKALSHVTGVDEKK